MDLDPNVIIGTVIGYLIATVVRWLHRTRFWAGVKRSAERVLTDPENPINDAREATEAALAERQSAQVAAVARSLNKEG